MERLARFLSRCDTCRRWEPSQAQNALFQASIRFVLHMPVFHTLLMACQLACHSAAFSACRAPSWLSLCHAWCKSSGIWRKILWLLIHEFWTGLLPLTHRSGPFQVLLREVFANSFATSRGNQQTADMELWLCFQPNLQGVTSPSNLQTRSFVLAVDHI